jgi:cyclohexanone monooxygenase
VQARYNARVQERLKGTVWSSGCMSWYLTRTGKNTTIWPGFTFEFRRLTRRFDAPAYVITPQANAAQAAAPPQTASVAQAPESTTSSRSFTLT